ncbi:MAG: hypothetical protein RLZZ116_134 [Planctomycetota bacterium]|jgi:RND family efflux transporter MFP subunit
MNPGQHHPRARFIARVLVPTVLLGIAGALLAHSSWRTFERLPEARIAPVAIIAGSASPQSGGGGLQAPGWIEPAPFATEVRALREGVVESIAALEGARVAQGEILATLERAAERVALARREAELRLAEADVVAKRATRDAAARSLDLALDASRAVRAARLELAEAESSQAKLASEVAETEALEAEARDEHERKLKLVAAGAVSEGEVRRLGLRVAALKAKVESLRAEQPARMARVEAAKGDLEAAQTLRSELLAETRARDEAAAALDAATAGRDAAAAMRDEARLALDRSEIRAPRAGVVMRRLAADGARVGGDAEPLFMLYDPAMLQVRCDVPLKDAGGLAIGLEAEIRVDALPNRSFRGTVVRIVPQGDIQKNTVQCKIAIESPDPALSPDMLAKVRIRAGGARVGGEGVAVPAEALRAREGERAQVLVAIPDAGAARTEARAITLGAERANGWIEVLDGLAGGDRVVLDPSIADGMRISPVEIAKVDAP